MPQRDQTPTTTIEAWGITPTSRVWIGGNNTEARREIERIFGHAQRPPTGEIDRAFVAPLSTDEAVYFVRKLRLRLTSGGSIWIVYTPHGTPREHEFVGSFEDMVVALFEQGFAESGRANLTADYTSTGFHLNEQY